VKLNISHLLYEPAGSRQYNAWWWWSLSSYSLTNLSSIPRCWIKQRDYNTVFMSYTVSTPTWNRI